MSSLAGSHRALRGGSSTSGTDTKVLRTRSPTYTTRGDSPSRRLELSRQQEQSGQRELHDWGVNVGVQRLHAERVVDAPPSPGLRPRAAEEPRPDAGGATYSGASDIR